MQRARRPLLSVPPATISATISATMRASTRAVFVALAISVSVSAPAWSLSSAEPCWRPPVTGRVVDHFRAPGCPYCAGNRGIEFGTDGSVPVLAVEAGVVTFSGDVAGTLYVVIEHANGWKVTYGRLDDVDVRRGQRVAHDARVGVTSDEFYFGVRIGGEYRDPEPFIGARIGRPRLVPVDGSARRSPPVPTWSCRS